MNEILQWLSKTIGPDSGLSYSAQPSDEENDILLIEGNADGKPVRAAWKISKLTAPFLVDIFCRRILTRSQQRFGYVAP